MLLKPFYEMRPDQILDARNKSGCAFIPVGPIEWHSYHLPIGTDALIAEGICRLVAERVSGVYFKPLFCGTDMYRSEEQLVKWGFNGDEKIFGMNFPGLPLVSEYCSAEELISAVKKRLEFVKNNKFKIAFVVDNHGGDPAYPENEQKTLLANICREFDSPDFQVEFTDTFRFYTLKEKDIRPGHADLAESTMLLSFRPDLIDLTKIPKGKLTAKKYGIIMGKPVLDEDENPRNISKALADRFRENVIKNFSDYVKELISEK